MKALIVEPSRLVATVISSICEKNHIEPQVVARGQAALEVLGKHRYGLLCFAYELADMNGIDFFLQAKAAGLLHDKPSVMFASTHEKAVVTRALEAGVTECLSKRQTTQLEQMIASLAQATQIKLTGRALLVEDSATIALFTRRVLEGMGLGVDHVTSAEAAIKACDAHHFDIILIDYVLSGTQSGLSVIRSVRGSTERKALTPILAMSAFHDVARKVELLRSGANDFVQKPVIAEELEVRVRNLLTMRHLMRQLESQSRAMKDMAMHDQLTSLYNRHYLQEKMPLVFEAADRKVTPISLIVADIDHFKAINDQHGHAVGDLVLIRVADQLAGGNFADEIVARVGGEEFVIITQSLAADDVERRVETLRSHIEQTRPGGISITASFGVAHRCSGENFEKLFQRADAAVYAAKDAGRNRVVVAS